jgi:hypothetical protein
VQISRRGRNRKNGRLQLLRLVRLVLVLLLQFASATDMVLLLFLTSNNLVRLRLDGQRRLQPVLRQQRPVGAELLALGVLQVGLVLLLFSAGKVIKLFSLSVTKLPILQFWRKTLKFSAQSFLQPFVN